MLNKDIERAIEDHLDALSSEEAIEMLGEIHHLGHCIAQAHGENYSLYHGDSVKIAKGIPDNSIGLQLSSWPFSNQYGYSDQLSDMGTTKSEAHFFEQMDFLIPDLLRTLIPGRLSVVHCKDRII
jgi:hypothetical protein